MCYVCYMKEEHALPTLAHRDLRNRSAEVLRRVRQGESFHVTNRGEIVALIAPAGTRSELRVRPARTRGGFATLQRMRLDRAVQEHIDALRGER